MRDNRDPDGESGLLTVLLPVGAVAICCGGPLLLGLLVSAGISGAVIGGILPAAELVLAVAALARRRSSR